MMRFVYLLFGFLASGLHHTGVKVVEEEVEMKHSRFNSQGLAKVWL